MNLVDKMGTDKPATLGEMTTTATSTVHRFAALTGENLGHLTLKICVPIRRFIELSEVGNRQTILDNEKFNEQFVAQRPLMRDHAANLGVYTLMGLVGSQISALKGEGKTITEEVKNLQLQLGKPPYTCIQPIVVNIRACKPSGSNISIKEIPGTPEIIQVALTDEQIFWVIDGQHRRQGFGMVLDFLKNITRTYKYPKRGLFSPTNYDDSPISESLCSFWNSVLDSALTRSTVSIEVHLGLNSEQEQQLFFDLNQKGRKVPASLAYAYDHTDAVNVFVKDDIIEEKLLPFIPKDSDSSDWHVDDGALARKDVNSVSSFLFQGKGSSKGATPALISERREFAIKFWEIVCCIPHFGIEKAKTNTVSAQPVVLKALAKLAYDLAYGTPALRDTKALEALYNAIKSNNLSFSHDNELWQALFLTQAEREEKFPGIEKYVFVPRGTNLDAGTYDDDNKWVRYGSRHNDIYQRLGDIIRYQLSLDPRPTVTRAIDKESRAIQMEPILEEAFSKLSKN